MSWLRSDQNWLSFSCPSFNRLNTVTKLWVTPHSRNIDFFSLNRTQDLSILPPFEDNFSSVVLKQIIQVPSYDWYIVYIYTYTYIATIKWVIMLNSDCDKRSTLRNLRHQELIFHIVSVDWNHNWSKCVHQSLVSQQFPLFTVSL